MAESAVVCFLDLSNYSNADSAWFTLDKVTEFTDLLLENEIPLLVFSAGLGDVIELILKKFSMLTNNVRVVSNFMDFDENGLLVSFSDPIIHTFNKTAASIMNGDYATISHQRPCVLLLGDSTGDVHMADGATIEDPTGTSGTVLRIGFLNESVETYLEKFQNLYDIVLVNDDSFDIPLAVMRCVVQCHQIWAIPQELPYKFVDSDSPSRSS